MKGYCSLPHFQMGNEMRLENIFGVRDGLKRLRPKIRKHIKVFYVVIYQQSKKKLTLIYYYSISNY